MMPNQSASSIAFNFFQTSSLLVSKALVGFTECILSSGGNRSQAGGNMYMNTTPRESDGPECCIAVMAAIGIIVLVSTAVGIAISLEIIIVVSSIILFLILALFFYIREQRAQRPREEPHPDVDGASIVNIPSTRPIPSPITTSDFSQSRHRDASSILTLPPIHLSTHASRSALGDGEIAPATPPPTYSSLSPVTPPLSSGPRLTQTSPINGAMTEGPGAEPARWVQQPGTDAVGCLSYEDSGIRMPPAAYMA